MRPMALTPSSGIEACAPLPVASSRAPRGYDTAVISGAEQALQKHLGLDAFWHGVTASSALIGCVIGSAFSGYFASGLGRRNSLRLAALLFFLSA